MTSIQQAFIPNLAAENYNLLASSLLIAVWEKLGIRHFFVSPGYRDAPFIAALQLRPHLSVYSCFDERAAAYQALGCAKATGEPAVLLCTSGTAGANYLPAVIEASVDQVPLVVLTADRPFELVHAAAQQVIDQRQLFGRFVKKSLEFPVAGPNWDPKAWVSYARELYRLSRRAPVGPVHINLPFQEPLDPVAQTMGPGSEQVSVVQRLIDDLQAPVDRFGPPAICPEQAQALRRSLQQSRRGFVILGRIADPNEQLAARAIAEQLAWPVYADIGSGSQGCLSHELLDVQHPELRKALIHYQADCVLHLGRRVVSRQFDDFLARHAPLQYWVISEEDGIQDPAHLPQRQQFSAGLLSVSESIRGLEIEPSADTKDLLSLHRKARARFVAQESQQFAFADVARIIARQVSATSHGVFLGNSLAIRAFDSWVETERCDFPIQANRGVSGIEGLLATTIGLVLGSAHPWTLVIGDVSLMHDLNSLLSLGQLQCPLIIVVVNNQGGRIFETLPIQAFSWVKDPLITTPHAFEFSGLAQMAGLDYQLCEAAESFASVYAEALTSKRPSVIECRQLPLIDQEFQSKRRTTVLA